MLIEISYANIIAKTDTEIKAAEILADEIEARCGRRLPITPEKSDCTFIELKITDESKSEEYEICCDGRGVTVCAHRLRGLIYGFFLVLRKAELKDGRLILKKILQAHTSLRCPSEGKI